VSATCQPGCGACCDPVRLSFDPKDFPQDSPNHAFVREHWAVTSTVFLPEHGVLEWRIRCDAFDPHTRRCTAHDRRPPICAGYPWYGQAPTEIGAHGLDLVCAYQADVRTTLPLVAVTHGEDRR
jgi:Fe-S-cluster containining protein